jgi:hypothetical protein
MCTGSRNSHKIVEPEFELGVSFRQLVKGDVPDRHEVAGILIEPASYGVYADQRVKTLGRAFPVQLRSEPSAWVDSAVKVVIQIYAPADFHCHSSRRGLRSDVKTIAMRPLRELNQQEQPLIRIDVIGNGKRGFDGCELPGSRDFSQNTEIQLHTAVPIKTD